VTLCQPGSTTCASHGTPFAGGKAYSYSFGLYANYPSGLNWFHAHEHGLAQAQVSGGMSGLISIGSPCDYISPSLSAAAFTALCTTAKQIDVTKATEVFLGLRDSQIINVSTGIATRANSSVPTFCGADLSVIDTRKGECNGIKGQSPKGVDNGCLATTPDGTCKWVFTINGRQYPTLTFDATGPTSKQVWRIANMSADVTYNLVLRRSGTAAIAPGAPVSSCADCLNMTVLNLDGVPAIGKLQTGQATKQKSLVLMPGSRAEVLVEHASAQAGATYRLEQISLNTGGDDWPAMGIAEVVFAPAPIARVAVPALTLTKPAQFAALIRSAPVAPIVPASCGPTVNAVGGYQDVTVGFFIAANGEFQLATGLGKPAPKPFTKTDTGALLNTTGGKKKWTFQAFGHAPGGVHPSHEGDLCVRHGATVRFHLLNFSGEIHNFHIHQSKFVIGTVFAPDSKDAPLTKYYNAAAGRGTVHDTVPIPRATFAPAPVSAPAGTIGPFKSAGLSRVLVPFDRPEQIGKFVYHCHILEHEDGGMMASIIVF
jgi:FtsP/CotA-like multicopper oxidase with cupredoxin domain